MPTGPIKEVNVLPLYGPGFLNREGTGTAWVDNTGTITRVQCEVFAPNGLPTQGTEYTVSGIYAEAPGTNLPFSTTLICTVVASPMSQFDRKAAE